jgi:mono/diheme cytochrome c family protein
MRQQQRYDPYEGSALFADGMAMRAPPAGTVARELRDVPSAVATGLQDGAPVQQLPVAVTPGLLAAGQRAFEVYCDVCHGADGSGRSIMADNMPGPRPPSLVSPEVAAYPPGQLFAVISGGKARMPAFSWALPPSDRWAVIAYIRTVVQTAPAAPAP